MNKKFLNRKAAGVALAEKLVEWKSQPGIVLAIPRGGIPVAAEIAAVLHWPLGLLWVKKIGHPFSQELAIGAVTESEIYTGQEVEITDPYVQSAAEGIRDRFASMKKALQDSTDKLNFKDKVIIIVDDGIATGHTLLAAIRQVRKKKPATVIAAIPVAPPEAIHTIETEANKVIVLHQPEYFTGISGFYEDFKQLTTEEAAACLAESSMKGID